MALNLLQTHGFLSDLYEDLMYEVSEKSGSHKSETTCSTFPYLQNMIYMLRVTLYTFAHVFLIYSDSTYSRCFLTFQRACITIFENENGFQ